MIPVSNAFHEAIREDELQMPLFIFDHTVMSSQDFNISSGGIRLSENVNEEEDYAPGGCTASILSFDLMNEDGRWSDFSYGEMTAYLGVRTVYVKETGNGICRIDLGTNQICGYDKEPYLRLNGQGVSGVSETVEALALFREKLFVFLKNSYVTYRYDGSSLTKETFDVYDTPIVKNAYRWKILHYGIAYGHKGLIGTGIRDENNLLLFKDSETEAYEMIPLGVFIVDKPMYNSRKTISIDAYDRMSLLDVDYEKGSVSFPITVIGLLKRVCEISGIPLSTVSIANGDKTISEEPDAFKTATLREIVSWIAEISGNFARMNRYGELELRWFSRVSYALDAHDYSVCDVGYYEAAGVDRVVIRDRDNDDVVSGTGNNAVYIQNNPLSPYMN